ncbi:MAG: methyltransferase domain-containing protein [Rhodobacter sp.]|nr:methyltransferase domain-containing protein [Rhodobacter sp.]
MDDLTCDAFLGGKLRIWQPRRGYRAGVDPVFLAAAVPAVPGQSVLELGCGVGTALLCLQARVPGLALTGLERQPDYAALARRNAAETGAAIDIVTGDLARMPKDLRDRQFDHVIANPPYLLRGGTAATEPGREAAVGEATPLAVWIDAALRRLAPKGHLTVIQRADRLPDLLAACDSRIGSLQVLPLAPRADRAAELVILRGRKGGGGGFRLLAPVILHRGDRHLRDGDDYAPEAQAILRDGAQLKVDRQSSTDL